MSSGHWSERPEGGGRFALRLILWIAKHLGRGVARLLLWPITAYFLIARPAERKASRQYLSRILDRPASIRDVARHIHTFAATILDRVYLLVEGVESLDVRSSGHAEMHATLDAGRGVLVLGSHLGSFEVMRALARKRPQMKVKILMKQSHGGALMQTLAQLSPNAVVGIIDVDQHPVSVVQEVSAALKAGELVTILNDRCAPGEQGVRVPFLGDTIELPTSALSIAAVLRAPVWLGFGLYRGGNRYDLVFEQFATTVELPRGQRQQALEAYTARYAQRLEHFARSAPFNWFNFYDVWDPDRAQ